jgi:hypothetical protein
MATFSDYYDIVFTTDQKYLKEGETKPVPYFGRFFSIGLTESRILRQLIA